MNSSKKRLSSALIAVAALTAVSAFAESNDAYPVQPKTQSTLTRAQVEADAAKAEKSGGVLKNDDSYPKAQKSTGPGKTRAQVKAELKKAEAAGQTPEINNNNYPAATK
ncbi:hypothetical protein RD110_09430 [Rhodoferax koreense]|uniref:DUF4148 domain-containing protein n=1 Tax=Rhodoferax koreensis TaxID=1842727 RepID=A0A1P8JUD1_9BURK|nr:DUF4148 domain-containing protein [Rhodoferax koreense]APW37380.1 hypothetical protein RD110_09430 [Rhodoferax koreense]